MQKTIYNKLLVEQFEYIINIDKTSVAFDLSYKKTLTYKGSPKVLINKFNNTKNYIAVILSIVMKNLLLLNTNNDNLNLKLFPIVIIKGILKRCLRDILLEIKSDKEFLLEKQVNV
ncbi:hypothetical protein ABK040_011763 [Willaertia magna]